MAHSAEIEKISLPHDMEKEKLSAENCKIKDELVYGIHFHSHLFREHLLQEKEMLQKYKVDCRSCVDPSFHI